MERPTRYILIKPDLSQKSRSHERSSSKEKLPFLNPKKTTPYLLPPINLKSHSKSSKTISSSLLLSLNSSQIDLLLKPLTKKLAFHNIPKSISKTYSELISQTSTNKAKKFVEEEISALDSGSAIILQCVKAYQHWEDSIKTIKEMVEFLGNSPGWIKLKDVIDECSSSLCTHVLLTLNLVEVVISWTKHLKSELKVSGQVQFVGFTLENDVYCGGRRPVFVEYSKEVSFEKKNSFSVEKGKIFVMINKRVVDKAKELLEVIGELGKSSISIKNKLFNKKNKGKQLEDVKKIAKLFTERIFIDAIAVFMFDLAKEVAKEELLLSVHAKYLTFINDFVLEIAKQSVMEVSNEIGSKKAHKLHLLNIIESIVRNLIEEEIQKADLETLCETQLKQIIESQAQHIKNPDAKKRLTRISLNLELERLTESLFHSLTDSFIEEDWLLQLASNIITSSKRKSIIIPPLINNKPVEEIEDFALEEFTPGVHSPNEVLSRKGTELNSPVFHNFEESKRQFSNTAINLNLAKIEPLNEDPKKIEKLIWEYFQQLPKEFESALNPRQVFEQAAEMCNSQFYWLVYDGNACGFFCYSLRSGCFVVHHVSCLNFKFFEEFLWHLAELAGFTVGEVVLQFNRSVFGNKSLMSALKKKKFTKPANDKPLAEFVWNSGKVKKSSEEFKISTVCVLETGAAAEFNLKTCPEMIQLGNRHSIISLLLKHFKSQHRTFEDTPIRLQQDLNELLAIMKSLNFHSYSLFSIYSQSTPSQLAEKCSELSINPNFFNINPTSFSTLNLNFSLSSVSFVTYTSASIEYKYLRFNAKIKLRVEENTKMFILQTKNPEIQIFFIKSQGIKTELTQTVKTGKTDLFYNIDSLVKALQGEEDFEEDLWVPCFRKGVQMKVEWMEGFSVGPKEVVVGCSESMKMIFSYCGEANRSLKFVPSKNGVIEEDFVFGVYSKEIREVVDSPLCMVLVTRDDFVRVDN